MTAILRGSIALSLACLLTAPCLAQRSGHFRGGSPGSSFSFSFQQNRPNISLFNSTMSRPSTSSFTPPTLQRPFSGQVNNPFSPSTQQHQYQLQAPSNQANNPFSSNTGQQRYQLQAPNSQANNPFGGQPRPPVAIQNAPGSQRYNSFAPGGNNQAQNPLSAPGSFNNQGYNPGSRQQYSNDSQPGVNNQANNSFVYNQASTSYYNQMYPRPDLDSRPVVQPASFANTTPGQPQPQVNQQPAFQPPAVLELTERYLKVRNTSDDTIKLYVRYYGDDGSGQRQWFPVGGEAAKYTLPPGSENYLSRKDGTRIRAEKIRFEAYSMSGQSWTPYRSRDLFLVSHRQGLRSYQATSFETFTMTLRK